MEVLEILFVFQSGYFILISVPSNFVVWSVCASFLDKYVFFVVVVWLYWGLNQSLSLSYIPSTFLFWGLAKLLELTLNLGFSTSASWTAQITGICYYTWLHAAISFSFLNCFICKILKYYLKNTKGKLFWPHTLMKVELPHIEGYRLDTVTYTFNSSCLLRHRMMNEFKHSLGNIARFHPLLVPQKSRVLKVSSF